MGNIKVTNSIEINSINIIFNDIEPSSSMQIDIQNDIDLKSLVNKLIEVLELNCKLTIEFVDTNNLADSNSKIKLIKETLVEIYNKFNEEISDEVIAIQSEPKEEINIKSNMDDSPF